MDEERGRHAEHERPDQAPGREGGLIELLRRVVAPRQPTVLVMERDGRLRRAGERAVGPGE